MKDDLQLPPGVYDLTIDSVKLVIKDDGSKEVNLTVEVLNEPYAGKKLEATLQPINV